MEYGIVKLACLEEVIDHPLKPVVITVRNSCYWSIFSFYFIYEQIENFSRL